MKTTLRFMAGVAVAAACLSARLEADTLLPPLDPHGKAAACGGEQCDAVVRGFLRFFDRRLPGLDGNGRSCADCHMASDSFQLSPAAADARFKLLQLLRLFNPRADDPLFRAVDADDFRTAGAAASNFRNLRENGLIRITFALPPNIKLIDPATNAPSSETFVDVWRAVPTIENVALTGPDLQNPWPRGPNLTGGYQLDARIETLQEQARGALVNHAQIKGTVPQSWLDDLSAFQRNVFTNPRVRDLATAVRKGTFPLPDPDPRLNALEQKGKAVFERACAQCHGGPGQSLSLPGIVRYHDIGSQCPRPVDFVSPARFQFKPCPERLARNARTYEITFPGTDLPPQRRTTSDPGRALLTGFVSPLPPQAPFDDWQKFDVPGLRGISRTAPYFHNNSAATLEEVVDHYTEFFKRAQALAPPGVIPPILTTNGVTVDRPHTPAERPALLAYLRKL